MKTHLNLLPHRLIRRQAVWAHLKVWVVVGAIALTLALGMSWQLAQTSLAARRKRDQLEEQYRPVTQAEADIKQMRIEIARLRQEQLIVLALANDEPALPLVGLVSRAARASESEVIVQHLSFTDNPNSPSPRILSVQGMAKGTLAIARFAAKLRDSNAFASVDLKSTEVQTSEGGATHRYHLECVF